MALLFTQLFKLKTSKSSPRLILSCSLSNPLANPVSSAFRLYPESNYFRPWLPLGSKPPSPVQSAVAGSEFFSSPLPAFSLFSKQQPEDLLKICQIVSLPHPNCQHPYSKFQCLYHDFHEPMWYGSHLLFKIYLLSPPCPFHCITATLAFLLVCKALASLFPSGLCSERPFLATRFQWHTWIHPTTLCLPLLPIFLLLFITLTTSEHSTIYLLVCSFIVCILHWNESTSGQGHVCLLWGTSRS